MALQPKNFEKINISLLKNRYDNNGQKLNEKEMRKKLENIRKKVKIGKKYTKIYLPSTSYVYGLANPKHENIADLIYNSYGNKAEKKLIRNYKSFIAEKIRIKKRPLVIPRFISPKVAEMKKKEEERKANILGTSFKEKKEKEKPLYKLKMFESVGSKVAENIRKFRTFKPIKDKRINKSQDIYQSGINKIKEKIEKEKENIKGI